jgi:glycosyltransferase involved in cell wall biosynthesis
MFRLISYTPYVSNSLILFVIPAFNEGQVIYQTIKPIINAGYKVVCVDDGSTDDSAELASKAGAYVVKHMINSGQGASIQTGFQFIMQSPEKFADAEYVVTFDADGQHSLSDLAGFILAMEKDPDLDIVLGSRFVSTNFMGSRLKFYLLKLMAYISEYTLGVKLTDRHNGYRVIRKSKLGLFYIKSPGYEHADEFIYLISKNNLKYQEVATHIHYTEYSLSKGQPLINGVKMLFDRVINGWK